MSKQSGQSGQSLLQLMIVIAIMGIMGILVAKLTNKVGMEWMSQQLYSRLDFNAQATRRLLASQMRDASAASVIITRASAGQMLCSKVCWQDSSGSKRTIYQVGDQLRAADWGSNTTAISKEQIVVRQGLQSFVVYYPNAKDPSKISFCLVLSKQVVNEPNPASGKYKPPVSLIINSELELKNP